MLYNRDTMFSWLFSNKKNKTELVVILDIGSASVGGALVNLSYNNKPTIIYTVRKEIAFSSEVEAVRLLVSMKRTLEAVSRDIQENGLKKTTFTSLGTRVPTSVFFVFSAPWYLAQPRQVKKRFDKRTNINRVLIEEIMEDEEGHFLEDASFKYSKIDKDELYLLEHTLTNLEIDGYNANTLTGHSGLDIQLSIFSTMIPRSVADSAIDAVGGVFHTRMMHMHSFSLASFSVTRDMFDMGSYFFVDISGEVTEVNLINNGRIVESGTFPRGVNTLVRSLVGELGTNTEDAISRIAMSDEGGDSVLVFGQTDKNALSSIESEWCRELVSLLSSFDKKKSLASSVVFTADERFIPFFTKALKNGSVCDKISYGFSPNIKALTTDAIAPYISASNSARGDMFLFIEALFFNTSHRRYDKEDFATFQN